MTLHVVVARSNPRPEAVQPSCRDSRARTISLALTALHRVYAHAIRRQGFAGTSPVAALERAERPSDERKAVTVLTPAQLAAVVEHAAPAYRPVIAFMARTGCRVGEALGLT